MKKINLFFLDILACLFLRHLFSNHTFQMNTSMACSDEISKFHLLFLYSIQLLVFSKRQVGIVNIIAVVLHHSNFYLCYNL
ncbi:hypothetical protein A7K93_08290 [Candidatus Methylacidiphilum fumarolicum]|nr:hypothetical protein A7K73_05520 [Candidatus Methylacidiphilum fumarolicum]TFE71696.1 hypothetical protein A7K72_10410 [Candidatus Methylacidiphilum fumarolicum]TFE72598.1 hypothetical protein A7K93_08290 [Candidatus Methylacidiphilum fumarolicum]TFE76688.1 hypothetical protein A7D33_08615 [Candidatus Methylacidiphilum fumarolicum]